MTISVSNSERLSFRLLDITDESLFLDLDSDPEVMKFINGGKPTTKQEFHDVYVPRQQAFRNPAQGWGFWGVTIKGSDTFLGWILVRPMNFFSDNKDLNDIEVGWRFKQQVWGKGYATEAAQAVISSLRKQLGYNKFTAIAVADNTGSINIMKKLGMTLIKEDIHKDPLGDQVSVFYQLAK